MMGNPLATEPVAPRNIDQVVATNGDEHSADASSGPGRVYECRKPRRLISVRTRLFEKLCQFGIAVYDVRSVAYITMRPRHYQRVKYK